MNSEKRRKPSTGLKRALWAIGGFPSWLDYDEAREAVTRFNAGESRETITDDLRRRRQEGR